MKKMKIIVVGIVVAAITILTANGQNLVIKNVNVIDVEEGSIIARQDIWVENGIITKISKHRSKKSKNKNTVEIEGDGKYLLPGFIDTHVHVAIGPVYGSIVNSKPVLGMRLEEDLPRITSELLLSHGVTTSRDPGGKTSVTVQVKRDIASGKMAGPEFLVAGTIIDTSEFINLAVSRKNKDDVIAEIRRQKKSGVDFIKFYTSLGPELLQSGIEEAHRLNLGTIGHLHSTSWTEASQMGIDNIVHIIPGNDSYIPESYRSAYNQSTAFGSKAFYKWFEYVDLESVSIENMIVRLRENGTSVDPTLVVFHAVFFGNTSQYNTSPFLDQLPETLIGNWRSFFNFNLGWVEQDFVDAQKVWPKVQRFTKMLHDGGVLLTVGTDANNPWIVGGDSFHRELKLLTECGLSSAEVLKMGTLNGAKLLNIDGRTGTIEVDKEADFVLLNSNPLEDIENSRDIAMTISNGVVVYDSKE
ncbi:MAG: amidohydrolase family protein [Cyclobacteriaceae bacterium]